MRTRRLAQFRFEIHRSIRLVSRLRTFGARHRFEALTRGGNVHRHHILLSAACSVTILGAVVFAGHEPAQTAAPARAGNAPTRQEIIAEFAKASTGNVADAVDEATGQRGFMYRDMKPVFKTKVMGPATTAVLRRVLKSDQRDYPNRQLEDPRRVGSGERAGLCPRGRPGDGGNWKPDGDDRKSSRSGRRRHRRRSPRRRRARGDRLSGFQPQPHAFDVRRTLRERDQERASHLRRRARETRRLDRRRSSPASWWCQWTRWPTS